MAKKAATKETKTAASRPPIPAPRMSEAPKASTLVDAGNAIQAHINSMPPDSRVFVNRIWQQLAGHLGLAGTVNVSGKKAGQTTWS